MIRWILYYIALLLTVLTAFLILAGFYDLVAHGDTEGILAILIAPITFLAAVQVYDTAGYLR